MENRILKHVGLLSTPKKCTNKFRNFPSQNQINMESFWFWAFSDLVSNGNRGILGEFIVGSALGCLEPVREEWSSVDLVYREYKIEIKTSGYYQSWSTKSPTKSIFCIKPTKFWNKKDNTYTSEKKRWADIYICCFLGKCDPDQFDPLNMKLWTFYLLQTSQLNEVFPDQKSMALSVLQENAEGPYHIDELKEKIDLLINRLEN